MLVGLKRGREDIAESAQALRHITQCQVGVAYTPSFDLIPGERGGNGRMRTCAHGIWRSSIASHAVLCEVYGDLGATVGGSVGDGDQLWRSGCQTLRQPLDPGAHASEGVARGKRRVHVQPAATARLRVSAHMQLLQRLAQTQRRHERIGE